MKTKRAVVALILVLLMVCILTSCSIRKDTSLLVAGNTLWFGAYNGEPIQWRILGDGNDGGGLSRLLLSDKVLDNIKFKADNTTNEWPGSDAKDWCENFYNTALSAIEKAVLIETTKSDDSYDEEHYLAYENILDKDSIFFLSAEEADTIFANDTERVAYDLSVNVSDWLLRSPVRPPIPPLTIPVGLVDFDGALIATSVEKECGARPAFNLNLDSDLILLTSPAVDGKPTGELDSRSPLVVISTEEPTDLKLTLLDESREFFASKVKITSTELTFEYENATIGENEYISAFTEDLDGRIWAYGRITKPTESAGVITIDLSDITENRLCIFSEQYNGDKRTDYASSFSVITLHFTITNMLVNVTSSNTETTRNLDEEADYIATLMPEEGYTLPETISVRMNGDTLTEDDDYTYDSTSGVLQIPATSINGDIEIEANGVPIRNVTVQTEGNGTASATPTSGPAGTEITLSATPDSGWQLKKWETVPDYISIADNKFTMPDSDVEVKAVFELMPVTYTISVTDGEARVEDTKVNEAEADVKVDLIADVPEDKVFEKWVILDGAPELVLEDENETNTSFIMPAKPVSLQATFKDKPTETDPSGTDPAGTDPGDIDPSETDSSETDPSETDPSETDPSGSDPSETDPSGTDPSETGPTETEPSIPTDHSDKLPGVGDSSAIYPWFSLLILFATALLFIFYKRAQTKRRN